MDGSSGLYSAATCALGVRSMPTAARVARNESLFREVNERINDLIQQNGHSTYAEFVCECSRTGCRDLIRCPIEVYEDVRSDPRRFILVPSHVESAFETVVGKGSGYVVVEKQGEAGAIAERESPR